MNTNNINRASIFCYAWRLVKTLGYTLSEALKCAWANAKFRAKAFAGIIHFVFTKVDGSMREAFGTLATDRVPAIQGTRTTPSHIQVYFDTEKGEWRSFKKANLIKVY